MMYRMLAGVVIGAALLLAPTRASATRAAESPDSAAVLREARQEQYRFEALRRRNLPWSQGSGGAGPCDERIGRFCLTYNPGLRWTAPVEPGAIRDGRDRLLITLRRASERVPGDRWVTGQRVRYLVEARRYEDARAAARQCRAEGWWCSALTGMAAHYGGLPAEADSAFSSMLELQPPEERGRWLDPSDLVHPNLQRHQRRLEAAERESFVADFWKLADPFFSRPGNEVRSEHLSRYLLDLLQDRAQTADNISWGSDLREILMRYGWPVGWSRVRDTRLHSSEISFIGHYYDSNRDLLPPPAVFLDEAGLLAGEWDAESLRSRTAYAVPLADTVVQWLPTEGHQIARFLRGDSAVLVAGFAIPPDSLEDGMTLLSALTALDEGWSQVGTARASGSGAEGVLSLRVPARPLLVSVEALFEHDYRATRIRAGVPIAPVPPRGLAVSDLLFLRDDPELPSSLEQAIPLARTSANVRPGETLGVYWEVYGLAGRPPGDLSMALRLVSGQGGLLRRLAERVRLVRPLDPVEMRWQEPAEAGDVLSRTIALQVPPTPAGRYTLEVTVALEGEEPVVARQEVVVQ
jgi:hypothetical protein